VRRILSGAGFADIAIEPADEKIGGASLDDTVAFCMNGQPIQQLLQQGGAVERGALEAAFREALQPFVTPGGVFLDAAAWIVSARNP
jgi:hypothetical protein